MDSDGRFQSRYGWCGGSQDVRFAGGSSIACAQPQSHMCKTVFRLCSLIWGGAQKKIFCLPHRETAYLLTLVGASTTILLSESLATSYYRIGKDICGQSSDETGGIAE